MSLKLGKSFKITMGALVCAAVLAQSAAVAPAWAAKAKPHAKQQTTAAPAPQPAANPATPSLPSNAQLVTPGAPAAVAPSAPTALSPLETLAQEAFLVDAATGKVLFAKNADIPMPTSSMSKLMTMYLVFKALNTGKLSLESPVLVSEQAWRQEGSRMFLNIGQQVKVEDLIRGVVIQSGNDAAVALSEAVGGSEGSFVAMMNSEAQRLGMTHSHFMNATGLPDPQHYSTARDLTILAMALYRDFPNYYHYFSELNYVFNGIKQGNRNPLLYRGIGVDGLKTGHTEKAGFGLVASSVRSGRRLFMTVNGLGSMQERADEPAKILDWGYREFGLYPLFKKGERVADASVWMGESKAVALVPAEDAVVTLPHAARAGMKVKLSYEQPLNAPVQAGQKVGEIVVTAPGMDDMTLPLVAGADVPRLGALDRLIVKIKHVFGGA